MGRAHFRIGQICFCLFIKVQGPEEKNQTQHTSLGSRFLLPLVPEFHHYASCVLAVARTNIINKKNVISDRWEDLVDKLVIWTESDGSAHDGSNI